MRGGGAKQWISKSDFSLAPLFCEIACVERPRLNSRPISVQNDLPCAIADCRPIRFQNTFGGELPRAQLFVVPKDVALRMRFFGEEAAGQAHSLCRFRIVKRPNLNAGSAREFLQDWLGVDAVLGNIDDDLAIGISG